MGNLYLFNPTSTKVTVTVNNNFAPGSAQFVLLATSSSTTWAATTSAAPVPRTQAGNQPVDKIGEGANTLWVFPDQAAAATPVAINVGEGQAADDLQLYLFYSNGVFGAVLLQEGVVLQYLTPPTT